MKDTLISRRRYLIGLSIAALPFVALCAEQSPAQNVIVILADDMGWADLGPESNIDTPHLDQLAEEGVTLSRFYASAPICSPTRAAFLTGRYPHSVGVPELAAPRAQWGIPKLSLNHSAVTIPEALNPHGYASILIGKWHLGFDPEAWPRTHGFDEFWGTLAGASSYYDVKGSYHNETPIQITGYYTDAITDNAVDYLRARGTDQRFFMYLSYTAPHYPLEAPAELVYKYRTKYEHGLFAIYAAMVEQLDTGIGRVLATLDELGLGDNTLVIFMSDNGPSAEYKSYGPSGADFSNGPFREWKFSTYDGGLRVPFIARWGNRFRKGKTYDQISVTMDLLPTILETAGVTPKENQQIDGQSLLPILRGEEIFTRKSTLHWETQHNLAVIDGNWKLVHQFWSQPRLYNIASDATESKDLSSEHPEIVERLLASHQQWKEEHYPNPVPHQSERSKYHFPDWSP